MRSGLKGRGAFGFCCFMKHVIFQRVEVRGGDFAKGGIYFYDVRVRGTHFFFALQHFVLLLAMLHHLHLIVFCAHKNAVCRHFLFFLRDARCAFLFFFLLPKR